MFLCDVLMIQVQHRTMKKCKQGCSLGLKRLGLDTSHLGLVT